MRPLQAFTPGFPRALQILAFEPPHAVAARFGLILVTQQMECPVNGQQLKLLRKAVAGAPGLCLGRLRRYNDITQQLGVELCEFAFGHGEGEHVGRGIDFTVQSIKLANARVVDNEHADLGVGPVLSLERFLNCFANRREPYFGLSN